MKKTLLPLLLCLLVSVALLPILKTSHASIAHIRAAAPAFSSDSAAGFTHEESGSAASRLYHSLGLQHIGLSEDAFSYAYRGYSYMAGMGMLPQQDILTIVDFSQSSAHKRMYIIDMNSQEVLFNTYVAHGRNSGLNYAERFSNRVESLQSSLGFYITKGTYHGKHGLSLKLAGQEEGWNDNAETRAVVLHGADYIGSHRADAAYMGRSFGCPAVPRAHSAKVIRMIKNGTALFIYHPSQEYLNSSKLLNS